MRFLVISDIHANLAAFEAVLADAKGQWDKIWCLGDIVGYGPRPEECVARLREHDHVSLSGNHDWAVLGKLDISTFNADARTAITWTRNALSDGACAYLDALPPKNNFDPFTLAHASPRHPIWEYILEPGTAAANFVHFDTPYCLVGHTHNPALFEQVNHNRILLHIPVHTEKIHLNENRLILNPGSVGQPRDSDPRAAYALLDTEKMSWEQRRVAYPVKETQSDMRQHNLPHRLIARLEYGW